MHAEQQKVAEHAEHAEHAEQKIFGAEQAQNTRFLGIQSP